MITIIIIIIFGVIDAQNVENLSTMGTQVATQYASIRADAKSTIYISV